MKTVNRNNNNYVNLTFKTEAQATFMRNNLRSQLADGKVDPYYEARKTVRVYK